MSLFNYTTAITDALDYLRRIAEALETLANLELEKRNIPR